MDMKKVIFTLLSIMFLFLPVSGAVFAKDGDAEGAKDHPLFNRMPGYSIQRYEEKQFDSHSFRKAEEGTERKKVPRTEEGTGHLSRGNCPIFLGLIFDSSRARGWAGRL
jgi:hypothetical protein